MSPTPLGVTITATTAEGQTQDITEGVQVLYDHLIHSMDWGSGFLSIEDVTPIVALAQFCGFKGYEEAENYMAREIQEERQRNCPHPEWREEEATQTPEYVYFNYVCTECGLTRFDACPRAAS